MWFAGSIRGAIAFALVLSLSSSVGQLTNTTVLGVVLFTTIAFGALMPAVKWLLADNSDSYQPPDRFRLVSKDGELALIDQKTDTEVEERDNSQRRSWLHRSWRTLDDGFLKRLLIKPSSLQLRDQLTPTFRPLSRLELMERTDEG